MSCENSFPSTLHGIVVFAVPTCICWFLEHSEGIKTSFIIFHSTSHYGLHASLNLTSTRSSPATYTAPANDMTSLNLSSWTTSLLNFPQTDPSLDHRMPARSLGYCFSDHTKLLLHPLKPPQRKTCEPNAFPRFFMQKNASTAESFCEESKSVCVLSCLN